MWFPDDAHQGPEALAEAKESFGREARLLCALGAKHLVERSGERVTQLHLESVDPQVRAGGPAALARRGRDARRPVRAVGGRAGDAAVPPGAGELTTTHDRDVFCAVEQDLHPVTPDVRLPVGARTAGCCTGCVPGPVPRWTGSRPSS